MPETLKLNLAIVGGGRTCRYFLELLQKNHFPFLSIHILGVCDIDPEAEGMRLARDLGIPTTDDYHAIIDLPGLNGVIELTHNREVLLDLIRRRPKGVWVLEHNIGRLLQRLFILDEKLKAKDDEVALERMISDILLHRSNDRIVLLDSDFRILDANDGYLKAVSKSREQALGKPCYNIVYGFNLPCPELRRSMKCPMLETLRTGESTKVIHEIVNETGDRTYWSLETHPVKDRSGEVVRVIEIRRDIPEELPSLWEKRLQELKTDLGKVVQEDRMLSLGKLSTSCAHEINNPIQGLLTFSHLIKAMLDEKKPTEEDLENFKEFIGLMCSELERCGNIVSGLLSFARESPMAAAEVDLNEALRSVITLARHHMELQNIRLEKNLHQGTLTIRGDVNHLQQCFLNLIFNAIEAMPDGGSLTITTGLDEKNRSASVVIRDTGSGIDKTIIDRIFDPFYTTKSEGKGTGLGLSIVYGIVKGHKGQINIESEPGKGSAVTVTFPVVQSSGGSGDGNE
jgi:two-component system, NtrC family, sensor kinase